MDEIVGVNCVSPVFISLHRLSAVPLPLGKGGNVLFKVSAKKHLTNLFICVKVRVSKNDDGAK